MNKFLALFLACWFYSLIHGQVNVGHLTYKIDFSTDDEQLKSTLGLLESSKMEVFFNSRYTRSNMNMGRMMSISTITDSINDVVVILMDGFSGKSGMKSSISEMGIISDTSISLPIFKEVYKDILGFSCQEVIVENANGETSNYWVSNEINAVRLGQNYLSDEVDGFPLEFELYNKGLKMHLTAIHFSDKLDESNLDELFNSHIPEEYSERTKEEIFKSGF